MAALDRGAHRIGCGRPLQLRILRDGATRDVDLLELDPRVSGLTGDGAVGLVCGVRALAGNVDRPELTADVPGLEAREVSHPRSVRSQIVPLHVHRVRLVLPDSPREVVVPVDDRLRGENANRA